MKDDIPLMHYNVAWISPFCDRAIYVDTVESTNWPLWTMNLEKIIAIFAISAWANICSNANMITNFEAFDIGADLRNNTNDFMTET